MDKQICECTRGCGDYCLKIARYKIRRDGLEINVCGNCILPNDIELEETND